MGSKMWVVLKRAFVKTTIIPVGTSHSEQVAFEET